MRHVRCPLSLDTLAERRRANRRATMHYNGAPEARTSFGIEHLIAQMLEINPTAL